MYSLEGDSWIEWLHALRKVQFEVLVNHIPLGQDSTVLELGCGDGFQLGLLRRRFNRVLAIDPTHRPPPPGSVAFSFALAEALPFRDAAFDLVLSSSVFEHLQDRRRALEETIRVLRPGGYMACDVPSRWWKATSLLLNPVGYPLRVFEKWTALQRAAPNLGAMGRPPGAPGVAEVVLRWFCPPVHGSYASHLSEFQSYGLERWRETFRHPELVPVAAVPTPWHTQFGFLRFRLSALRTWLGKHGFNGTWVFVMRKHC